MSAILKPGALRHYEAMRDQLVLAADEKIQTAELLDGLSDNGGWWDTVGLLWFGFMAGAIAGSVLVLALGWLL